MMGCRTGRNIMNGSSTIYIITILFLAFIFNIIRCHNNMSPSDKHYSITPMLRCRFLSGLTRSQRKVCNTNPNATLLAVEGLKMAVKECQHQFRWNRWNCSSLMTKTGNPHSSMIMKRGYKETAFMYALSAAAVAHSVARGCSQGRILSCSCDPLSYRHTYIYPLNNDRVSMKWMWGGCSHNLDYGMKFSEQFLDSREEADDLQSKINVHNNRAGRQILSSNMKVRCKCHGVSGSCQMRTCWRATPELRIVAAALKRRYRNAVLVDDTSIKYDSLPLRGKNKRGRTKELQSNSLLYIEKSPTYCEANPKINTSGTVGRVCRMGGRVGGCDILCCGRGHDLVRTYKYKQCKCKVIPCCEVTCEQCRIEKWITVCK